MSFRSSNTDSSFTMAHSNSLLSPYEILPIVQENKYLRKFSYFIIKWYVECTHLNRPGGTIFMSTVNIHYAVEDRSKSKYNG